MNLVPIQAGLEVVRLLVNQGNIFRGALPLLSCLIAGFAIQRVRAFLDALSSSLQQQILVRAAIS